MIKITFKQLIKIYSYAKTVVVNGNTSTFVCLSVEFKINKT